MVVRSRYGWKTFGSSNSKQSTSTYKFYTHDEYYRAKEKTNKNLPSCAFLFQVPYKYRYIYERVFVQNVAPRWRRRAEKLLRRRCLFFFFLNGILRQTIHVLRHVPRIYEAREQPPRRRFGLPFWYGENKINTCPCPSTALITTRLIHKIIPAYSNAAPSSSLAPSTSLPDRYTKEINFN